MAGAKRRGQMVDCLFDGDVAAGQRALAGEGRLHGVDDGLDLHDQRRRRFVERCGGGRVTGRSVVAG